MCNLFLQFTKIIKIYFERYLFKHYPRGGTPSVMLRNIHKHRFMLGKRYSEDYLLWLEYCHDYSGVLINEVLAASFKEIYGAGGLSGNLLKIEQGELDTFNILKKKGYINSFIWILCSLFSIVKFLRRYLIVCYRNIVTKKGNLSCSTPPPRLMCALARKIV